MAWGHSARTTRSVSQPLFAVSRTVNAVHGFCGYTPMKSNALETLIARARGGDTVALKVVLTRTRGSLLEYVSGKIPQDCQHLFDAEDITQDTHILIFQNIRDIRSVRTTSFDRWTKAIALNRLRNAVSAYRAAKRDLARNRPGDARQNWEDSTAALFNVLAGSDETASKAVARADAVRAMETAMTTLPQHYQQAVRLVHLEGLPVGEAADLMGKTERAVHGLCRRALRRLEIHLGNVSKHLG